MTEEEGEASRRLADGDDSKDSPWADKGESFTTVEGEASALALDSTRIAETVASKRLAEVDATIWVPFEGNENVVSELLAELVASLEG